MASTRQILQRKRAAENISKVTNTMETISAVRYRQYYKKWLQGQDFYEALAKLAYLIVAAEQTIAHPLMLENKSRTSALVIIGSNRGLCGSYNSNVNKLIDVHASMAKRFNRDLKVYVKGEKPKAHLANKKIEIVGEFTDFEEVPSVDQAKEMADNFIDQYINGEIGRLSIVYTRFFSTASQRPQTLSILPIADLIDDLTTRATVIWPWEQSFEDFELEPSVDKFFDGLARMMVRTTITSCFMEASLSEHLSRIVAMRSATDNANEMIESLSRDYNRARQGQITGELMDIIGATLT
jgi:F-type H+-transporting ATPase subunit gamma